MVTFKLTIRRILTNFTYTTFYWQISYKTTLIGTFKLTVRTALTNYANSYKNTSIGTLY